MFFNATPATYLLYVDKSSHLRGVHLTLLDDLFSNGGEWADLTMAAQEGSLSWNLQTEMIKFTDCAIVNFI